MKRKKLILVIAFAFCVSCSESSDDCPTKTCSDFATQSQAQSTFDSDRDCYENLDSDNDKIACESLPD